MPFRPTISARTVAGIAAGDVRAMYTTWVNPPDWKNRRYRGRYFQVVGTRTTTASRVQGGKWVCTGGAAKLLAYPPFPGLIWRHPFWATTTRPWSFSKPVAVTLRGQRTWRITQRGTLPSQLGTGFFTRTAYVQQSDMHMMQLDTVTAVSAPRALRTIMTESFGPYAPVSHIEIPKACRK